jgi:hypothetical protein
MPAACVWPAMLVDVSPHKSSLYKAEMINHICRHYRPETTAFHINIFPRAPINLRASVPIYDPVFYSRFQENGSLFLQSDQ